MKYSIVLTGDNMLYPNSIKKEFKKNITYGNRGMNLESAINQSNDYYLDNDIAIIHKKPTPIGIVDVKYTNNSKIIDKAFFKAPSTLDYYGIYKGKYIEFDAKETRSKTAFPLSNIHPHQIKHIEKILNHGGFSFLIIEMNNIIFLLKGETLLDFINDNKRKSIPFAFLEKNAYIIKEGINPRINYLKIVDQVYMKGNIYEKN